MQSYKQIVQLSCFAAIWVIFNPIILLAQHETGSYSEHNAGGVMTHEVHGVEMIHGEYGGKAPERPGREPGNGGGNGGENGGSATGAATSKNSTINMIERKVSVTVNGMNFSVSKNTELRLAQFLNEYNATSTVGGFVAAIASIFSIFELFNIDQSFPAVDAIFKLSSFNADEVVTRLSIPSDWNRALRSQAASYCEQEMVTALSNRKFNDARMWLRIRDIISNPERYQNGGIKYDRQNNKLLMRSYPAEAYRNIAGFQESFTNLDINQLGMLTNYLMLFPQSRDYIIYADFIFALGELQNKFEKLTTRDKLYLNKALLSLPASAKSYLNNAFLVNAGNQSLTSKFWFELRKYLYQEKWNNGYALDSQSDELGFEMDELPKQSDIVWGNYPTSLIFNKNLPPQWIMPISNRNNIYTFYYPGN